MFKYRSTTCRALVIAALLAFPTGATAQSSEGGYNQPGGVVQDEIPTQPTAAPAAKPDPGGELPFTGFDLVLVGVGGGALMLLGLGIRGLARTTEPV